jgi:hypothetical protein
MIALLNAQLLVGTSISCLNWLRRSGGSVTDCRAVPVPLGARAAAQQIPFHSVPETQEVSGTDAVDGSGSSSS